MEKEPRAKRPTQPQPPRHEEPPPFRPDYEIIGLLEGGSPRHLRRFHARLQQLERQMSRDLTRR